MFDNTQLRQTCRMQFFRKQKKPGNAGLLVLMNFEVLSLPPESGSHNEMHNLVCGRISDEKDKGAVYAGI